MQKVTIEKILLGYNPEPMNILPALKKICAVFNVLDKKNAKKTANYFQVPLSRIFETASFYDLLKTEKKAALEIQICSGSNCATKDAYWVSRELEKQLNVKAGDKFNPDVKLEVMSCLGQCGQGPIMIINGTVFSNISPSKAVSILKGYL